MVLGISKDMDSLLTLEFLCIFLIGYLFSVYTNGIATLIFLENEYDITGQTSNEFLTNNEMMLQKYSQDIEFNNKFAWRICQVLYFGFMPLFAWYYFFKNYFIKRRLRKSDNKKNTEQI